MILVAVVALVGVGAWLVTGGDAPSYPIVNDPPRNATVIAFGDSITAGTGAPREQSYPAQLSRRLGIEIVNMGSPGETSSGGLNRVGRVAAMEPGIVLLCLGGNDILRRVPRDETFGNLEQIVERLQAAGSLVILIGVESLMGSAYGGAFEDLARRKGCPYVPHVLGGIIHDRDLMADQVHPNAQGYARMADKIEPVLRKYVERARPDSPGQAG